MKKIIIIPLLTVAFISLVLNGCGSRKEKTDSAADKHPKTTDTTANKPQLIIKDTVTALNKTLDSGNYIFKSHLGNYFLFKVTNDTDSISEESTPSSINGLMAAGINPACDGQKFDGHYRKTVKITPSKKQVETNVNAKELFSNLFSSEKEMCSNKNKLKENKREEVEDKNVQFEEVYIYTYKRQGDEDYHVIFGTTDNIKTALFFNGEISGLSSNASFGHKLLNDTRIDFENYFDIGDHCATKYYLNDFRRDPIPVKLTGSLFFDGEHCANYSANGPQKWTDVKLKSAWEIHPITKIKFLK